MTKLVNAFICWWALCVYKERSFVMFFKFIAMCAWQNEFNVTFYFFSFNKINDEHIFGFIILQNNTRSKVMHNINFSIIMNTNDENLSSYLIPLLSMTSIMSAIHFTKNMANGDVKIDHHFEVIFALSHSL